MSVVLEVSHYVLCGYGVTYSRANLGQLDMTCTYVMSIGLGSGQYPLTSILDGTSFTAKSVMWLVDDSAGR